MPSVDRGWSGKWGEMGAVFAIIALSFVLRLTFLHVQLEADEGLYATVAREILQGGVLYRDVIDVKPPAIYYLYALILRVMGPTSEGIRLFTDGYVLVTILALYMFARRLYGIGTALITALLYAVYSTGPLVHGSGNNCEVFMALPIIGALHLCWRFLETGRRTSLVLSGFCAALAVLLKPTALPYVAMLLVFSAVPAFTRWRTGMAGATAAGMTDGSGNDTPVRRGTSPIMAVLLNVLSFLVLPALSGVIICLFFAAQGALGDMLYWTTGFSKLFAAPSNVLARMVINGKPVLEEQLLLYVVGVPTAVYLVLRNRDLKSIFVATLLPVSAASVALPKWFSAHYFFLMVPTLSLLAGIGLAELGKSRKGILYPALLVIALAFGYSAWIDYKCYTVYTPEEVVNHQYPAYNSQTVRLAELLRQRTKPTEYLYVWGRSAEIYFLSGRRPANPFLGYFLIGASQDPARSVRLLQRSLLEKRPRYVVVEREIDPSSRYDDWPGYKELTAILVMLYDVEEVQANAILFRLKEPQVPGKEPVPAN